MGTPLLFNFVKMTTATTGTGTLTLGSVVGSFRSFASASVPDGAIVRYAIADPGLAPTQREWGTGVYTASGTLLTRVLGGSTTGALLNLSGAAHVAITPTAEDLAEPSQYVATGSTYAMGVTDDEVFIKRTSGICTVSLCAASSRNRRHVYIADIGGNAGNIISVTGSDLFADGSSSFTLYNAYAGIELIPAYVTPQWTWIVK